MKKSRFVISLPPFLKKRLEHYAHQHECSQAEIIRLGLIKLMEEEKHDASK